VAKSELGLKRLCPSCGAKYYDLNRTPILCPKCGSLFDSLSQSKVRAVVAEEEEPDVEETEEVGLHPEFVSLDEADNPDGDDVPDIEDPEIDDTHTDDDVFLEEEDEDGGDMSDIIGDVDSEEER
jgi:uncharacterized protein (TIGR02300 family)